jgi:DNA-binding winged helix-turn-helix (wHTH) protein/Tol biopolymer transport system component
MSLQTKKFYEFADFRLDLSEKILLHDGKTIPLTPKVFDTLQILVENAGHLLEKDFLMKTIWQDRFVEESNLTFNIKMLRKALGDSAANPKFIETVPKRGYRFITDVKEFYDNHSAVGENGKPDLSKKPRKPYFLISVLIVLLISLFGFAFIWFNENQSFTNNRASTIRLTKTGKITNAVVTHDGENIVFAQKEGIGESLWIQQINSGEQTQILPPQEINFIGLMVSPDNAYAYYSGFSGNSATLTLSRISLKGGKPEPLSEIATDISISFSPDGSKFTFTESYTSIKETRLKTADADGSNQKVLIVTKGEKREFPIFRASPVAWSPDGETIACSVKETDENGSFYRILLVDPNDGSEKYLLEKHWNLIEYITWRDDENLAFIESEQNSPVENIWQISRKTGEVRQLTNDLNSYEWLSSANGKLFAVQKNFFSSLQVADFTENTNKFQSKQILGESDKINNVVWSKDGKIFYNSWASGKNEIWQIDADGTSPRQLTKDSHLTSAFGTSPIDNMIVFSTLQNGKIFLSTADSKGQNIHQITDGTPDTSPGFSADGKTIFFQRGGTLPTIWQVVPAENQPPKQITGYFATHPSISPDGQKIAYHFMDYGSKEPRWKLGIINSKNHRLLNKLEFPFSITERKIVWHPNGNLLTMVFSEGENEGILLLSATDGKFRTIDGIASGKITSFDWSPDGSRFTYSQQFETSNVVLLGEL